MAAPRRPIIDARWSPLERQCLAATPRANPYYDLILVKTYQSPGGLSVVIYNDNATWDAPEKFSNILHVTACCLDHLVMGSGANIYKTITEYNCFIINELCTLGVAGKNSSGSIFTCPVFLPCGL